MAQYDSREGEFDEQRKRLQGQIEGLLEEMMIKLSSVVSNLFGVSGRRILKALAGGEDDPGKLASLGDPQLRVSQEGLREALTDRVRPARRLLLGLYRQQVELIDAQIAVLEREMSAAIRPHQATIERLADLPGLGVDSAHQIIAEMGPEAATFPSAGQAASWVGSVRDERKARANRTTIVRRKAIDPCDVY